MSPAIANAAGAANTAGVDANADVNTGAGWSAFGGDPYTDPNGHGTAMANIAAAKADTPDGRTLVPVSYITVRVRLEPGERVRSARLATSERVLSVQNKNSMAEVIVPQLADHEIVVFELAEAEE